MTTSKSFRPAERSRALWRTLCGVGAAGLLLGPAATATAVGNDLFCSVEAPVFADKKVSVKQHSAIRGDAGALTHVMSNGKVKMRRHAVIDGHVTAARVKLKGNASVTGDVVEMAPGVMPEDATDLVAAFAFQNDNHHIPMTMMGKHPLMDHKLKVGRHDRLVLPAGDYYLEELRVKKHGVLELAGPVRIFMPRGKVVFKYGSLVGASDTEFTITIAGEGHVKVGGHAGFHAAVYAPKSRFQLKGEGVASGSLVVDRMKVDEGAEFHAVDVCVTGPPELEPIPNPVPPDDVWPPELVIITDPFL